MKLFTAHPITTQASQSEAVSGKPQEIESPESDNTAPLAVFILDPCYPLRHTLFEQALLRFQALRYPGMSPAANHPSRTDVMRVVTVVGDDEMRTCDEAFL